MFRNASRILAITGAALALASSIACGGGSPEGTLTYQSTTGGSLSMVNVSPASRAEAMDTIAARAASEGATRVVIELAPSPSELATARNDPASAIKATQERVLASTRGTITDVQRFDRVPYLVAKVDETALRSLASSSSVVSIEADIPERASVTESVPLVGATALQNNGNNGKGWAVAILDTGFDVTHPFFADRIVAEACFSTTDAANKSTSYCPNGQGSQTGKGSSVSGGCESCNHGTHVAGIAAGYHPEGTGVAPGASLILVNIFSDFEGSPRTYPSDQVRGLEFVYSLRNQYKIASVNMSLGGGEYATHESCDADHGPRLAATRKLVEAGIAVIASSGNEELTSTMGTPACLSTVISVGSTTKQDAVSSFSNSTTWLSILAPGSDISSSVEGGQYNTMSGTSMASPHVAGTFALLKAAKPDATVAQLLEALQKTGKPIRDGRNGVTTPRIQVDKAVAALAITGRQPSVPTPQPTTPPVQPTPAPRVPVGVTNDDIANARVITSNVYRDSVDTRAATATSNEPAIMATYYCPEGGRFDHTVWYSFTAPANGYLTISTLGSDYDTILGAWLPMRNNRLSQYGCNDDFAYPNDLGSAMGGWVSKGQTFSMMVGAWDDGGTLEFELTFTAMTASANADDDGFSVEMDPRVAAVAAIGQPKGTPAACGTKGARPGSTCYTATNNAIARP